jgi:hypothetical protein
MEKAKEYNSTAQWNDVFSTVEACVLAPILLILETDRSSIFSPAESLYLDFYVHDRDMLRRLIGTYSWLTCHTSPKASEARATKS